MDQPSQLGQRAGLVRDGAKHQTSHGRIERPIASRQLVRHAISDLDRDDRARRRRARPLAQVGLGLHGYDPLHRGG